MKSCVTVTGAMQISFRAIFQSALFRYACSNFFIGEVYKILRADVKMFQ